jgi:hypothetical protein
VIKLNELSSGSLGLFSVKRLPLVFVTSQSKYHISKVADITIKNPCKINNSLLILYLSLNISVYLLPPFVYVALAET